MDTKRFFLYFIVIAALALAGCGGNGGGTDVTMPPTPTPMPCPDGQTRNADGDCVDPTPPAPAGPTHMQMAMAIADPDGNGLFAGLQKSERPNLPAGMTYPMANAGNPEGTGTKATISVSSTDTLGVDDMDSAMNSRSGQFQEVGGTFALGDFDGQAYSLETNNRKYDLTVLTDMKAPGTINYVDYYTDASDAPLTTRPVVTGGTFGADNTVENYGRLLLGQTGTATTLTSSTRSLFDADWFPEEAGVSKEIAAAATGANRMFSGMFNGVPGTYSCATGGACSVMNDKDGNLASIIGVWQFDPADGVDLTTTNILGVDHDTDFLAFGYWVQTTTNRDDTTEVAVNTFATGSQPYFLSGFSATTLEGSATYTGRAAGQYVLKTGPVGAAMPTASGGFTGNARLTALFGGTSVAADSQMSISGSITHLRNDAGQIIDPNWMVSLGKAGMSGGDAEATPLVFGTGTAINTGLANANASTTGGGSWQGGFFGIPTPSATTTEDYPNGVAGEFNAHFDNGHVIGAFGATR